MATKNQVMQYNLTQQYVKHFAPFVWAGLVLRWSPSHCARRPKTSNSCRYLIKTQASGILTFTEANVGELIMTSNRAEVLIYASTHEICAYNCSCQWCFNEETSKTEDKSSINQSVNQTNRKTLMEILHTEKKVHKVNNDFINILYNICISLKPETIMG